MKNYGDLGDTQPKLYFTSNLESSSIKLIFLVGLNEANVVVGIL